MKTFDQILIENINDLRAIKKGIKKDSNLINNSINLKGKDGKLIRVDYKDDEYMVRYGKNETEYTSDVKKTIKFINSLV